MVTMERRARQPAANLKASYRIAYADCFAVALSEKLDAPLVTGDPDFKQLAHEIMVEWIT